MTDKKIKTAGTQAPVRKPKTIDWYARTYIKTFGFHLVPIEPGRKFPRSADWGNKTLSNPEIAGAFYESRQDWNMGLALGPSNKCSLDIDCYDSFVIICDALGVDLDALIKDTPTIKGRGFRLMFDVPEGVNLGYFKLNWRPESDPTGDKYRDVMATARYHKQAAEEESDEELKQDHLKAEADARELAKQYAPYTVFELRSSCDGRQRQDILPPSIHPETGNPYVWVTQPRKDWPTPPQWLLTIWSEFEKIKPQLLAACPWAVVEEIYKPSKRSKKAGPSYAGSGGGLVAVVNEFNSNTSIEQALENYGYERLGKRYLSPSSQTRLPGVVVMPDSNKAWIHHASDPLCSDESGQPVSPFDLYCQYEHGGDFKNAAIALARELGLRTDTPAHAPTQTASDFVIDEETGEILSGDVRSGSSAPAGADLTPHANTPPVVVDYAKPLPWFDPNNGRPFKHVENLAEIAKRLNVTIRYNVIKKCEEILIPGVSFSLDNYDNASLSWLASECSLFRYSTDKLQEFVTVLADRNQYNPVQTWINSKPWDGVSRLQAFYDTVVESHGFSKKLKETMMYRWMLSAIEAAFNPAGVTARGVLVFQGRQQIGKTAWFKRLAPASLDVLQDGVILRPDDKDSVKQVTSNWIVELGELDATFRKSDVAQLKGFITRNRDVVRLPYARKESTFARRTVFFSSVNPREFLNDPTGNTRFWTVPCESINFKHEIDMQQLWAEVYEAWKAGESHHMTAEEAALLEVTNMEYLAIDPVEERITSALDWDSPESTWRWAQATDILIECGMDRPTRGDATKAAALLRDRNGNQGKRGSDGSRLLLAPKRKLSSDYFNGGGY